MIEERKITVKIHIDRKYCTNECRWFGWGNGYQVCELFDEELSYDLDNEEWIRCSECLANATKMK